MDWNGTESGARPLLRDRGKMSDIERQKRKSEVLIAAQSLDNEVQTVKNLKRISIGSIDLLMDPELEYRVNATSSNSNNRTSWSSGSSSSIDNEETERLNKRTSGPGKDADQQFIDADDSFDDSFEATDAEYLGSNEVQITEPEMSKEGIDIHGSEASSSESSLKRNLSGVGTLQRGVDNLPTRRISSGSASDETVNGNSALTRNLLWVPADQHPNIKPENYLELVQDALHNIQLDDESGQSKKDQIGKENWDGLERMPLDYSSKHKSLVRRPSRLRKSYTEFEEEESDYSEISSQTSDKVKVRPRSSTYPSRPISLKDITEELTKISNNAGLTDSDAVTLARTLSMAGSFTEDQMRPPTEEEIPMKAEPETSRNNDDKEFASNMFMKHGFVIPARSSLRRSKFNTYRKRTLEGDLKPDNAIQTSPPVSSKVDNRDEIHEIKSDEPDQHKVLSDNQNKQYNAESSPSRYNIESTSAMTSPSTISDFQEIYDHYRQSSVDWENELKQNSSGDEKGVSATSADLKNEGADLAQKKSGWSWLNTKGGQPKAAKSEKSEDTSNEGKVLDEDFIKTATHSDIESERLALIRSNHSKNRHQPISSRSGSQSSKESSDTPQQLQKNDKADPKTESPHSFAAVATDKRQRLEMKFVSLFKRKGKSKPKATTGTGKKPVQTEVKKKESEEAGIERRTKKVNDGLHNFTKNTKKNLKIKSESRFEHRLRSVSHDNASGKKPADTGDEALPMLQPAVSVTSTKSNQQTNDILTECVTESVEELDGDDSQDLSGDQTTESYPTASVDRRDRTREKSSAAVAVPSVPSQLSILPPRKLRFEDVKRPEKPNAPMQFSDSAFGFPLPMLTVSTVVMFDHRLPVNVERAIYRLSHLKLSDPKRELRQQVILSNFMYAYLNLVNHTLYMEQAAQDGGINCHENQGIGTSNPEIVNYGNGGYSSQHNSANGAICIPDI